MRVFSEAIVKRIRASMTEEQLSKLGTEKPDGGKFFIPESFDMQVLFAIENLDMSLAELVAMPEQDSWVYEELLGS